MDNENASSLNKGDSHDDLSYPFHRSITSWRPLLRPLSLPNRDTKTLAVMSLQGFVAGPPKAQYRQAWSYLRVLQTGKKT